MIESLNNRNKDFFDSVFAVVRLIPRGRVTTYGAIANYLGTAQSSRMVGWAMNASHHLPDVPAHRVVNRKGLLTGKMHFSHEKEMENLLLAEGIEITNDQIMNFQMRFWDPALELKID